MSKLSVLFALFLVSGLVAGCGSSSRDTRPTTGPQLGLDSAVYGPNEGYERFEEPGPLGYKPDVSHLMYDDRTTLHYDSVQGIQVEFTAADGRNYIWYPGNFRILSGSWRIEGDRICFNYDTPAVNPLTGFAGQRWNCQSVARSVRTIIDTASGDVLGLRSRGRAPWQLERQEIMNLDEMAERVAASDEARSQ